MITAETMINYGSYTISRYTYSADVSATGKELTMYEVYDNSVNDLIEAFDTLDEAIEHTENEIMWQWCLTDSFPQEVQEEHNQAAKALLIWFIANVRWIAAHEGERGIDRFVREVKAELKSA